MTEVATDPRGLDPPELVPVRMLNEFVYCPRLAYLEWVQSEFTDNEFTVEGRFRHRRVDEESGEAPEPADDAAPRVARSLMLSAPIVGLISKIDLVEFDGRNATPVDYKRGKVPDVPHQAYDPERVQLCAQGIVLRENGYTCAGGVLYFAASRRRVEVPFDDELESLTREQLALLRRAAALPDAPAPLNNSPKCFGCSLVNICLPDEVGLLAASETQATAVPRRIIPARDDVLPLYVQEQGAYIRKSGDTLQVRCGEKEVSTVRLLDVSQVNLFGNVQISTQTIQETCRRGIPISFLSSGGWLYGMTVSHVHHNIDLRRCQFRAADRADISLNLARRFVSAKVRNSRTMLRRNSRSPAQSILRSLSALAEKAEQASSAETLLGIEGNAGRIYFEAFSTMLKDEIVSAGFSFAGRNRRPPRDPVNAMLSLAYSLLTKDMTVAVTAAGLDPHLGFYHRPRYGRPSLALDLIEEFRPLLADSTVINAINSGIVKSDDFTRAGGGVALKTSGRRAFIAAYERRMDQLVRHPVFGYKISYRRVLDVQARLLGKFLIGEIPSFPAFLTR